MRWTASKLSRNCAHHHVLSDLTPRPRRDAAAKLGTDFHAALVEWYQNGVVPPRDGDVAEWLATMVANGWAWPPGCELEIPWGMSKWGTFVPVRETTPHVYESLDGEDLLTAGRADICWQVDDLLVICDWKTGRTQAPLARVNLQVNAAGIALAQKWNCDRYQPAVFYAREGRWDIGGEVERDSEAWRAALADVEAAAALDEAPHPGPHCGACWETKACPAFGVRP